MTIAACYLTSEGVVLGADSTSTSTGTHVGFHYFNYTQKLFELGEDSTLGVVTWGIAAVSAMSYRTLFVLLADDIKTNPPTDVADVENRWINLFWPEYSANPFIQKCKTLHAKRPFDKNASPPDPQARTQEEENEYQNLKRNLVVGFCIAGHVLPDRISAACVTIFDPLTGKPTSTAYVPGYWFWGAPNMIQRLVFGHDANLKNSILSSGKWTGTEPELQALLDQYALGVHLLPIREAIDFVHACIYSTIKALKFSNLSQICGGPIEIAVITSDRRFRWVRHKTWDMAITEGEPR